MNREEKILCHIDKQGHGVEIGPCYAPVAAKRLGYKVQVIDHMDRVGLISKYRAMGVGPELLGNIEEVDFVWQGESYAELTGKSQYYDWIIASHVIEHTPDLIDFLNHCDSILKGDGVISLVVPDKRYCFDHYRPVTSLSKIIDCHFQGNKMHSPGTAAEFYLNAVVRDEKLLWSSNTAGDYRLCHSLEDARQAMKLALDGQSYEDYHSWCFLPHSFRLLIHDLFNLELIPFQEVEFFPTAGFEFFVTLGRDGKGLSTSRLEMMALIESESHDGVSAV